MMIATFGTIIIKHGRIGAPIQEKTPRADKCYEFDMNELKAHIADFFNVYAMVKNLNNHRLLIRVLTRRDFDARFRGSIGGVVWSFVQPLIMMLVYTLVFAGFLQIRFGNSDSPFTFAVYLLCGLLPWVAFSETFSQATGLILANSNLVKRVVFPLEVLSISLVLGAAIQQVIGFILLLPLAWWVTQSLSWALLSVPLILFFQILFYIGLNWVWASLSVYIPDLRQLTSVLLGLMVLLTPIFYPEDFVPDWAAPFMRLNPFASLATMYRQTILEGVFPTYLQFLKLAVIAALTFTFGYFWFMKTKKGFADVL